MPAGRPLKFQSVEELEDKINEYFSVTPFEEHTITGLALHLDTTRELLCDYELKDEFSDTIRRSKMMIENAYEKRLIKRGNAGDIFALKNFGWKDKTEQDITSAGKPIPLLYGVRSNNSTEEDTEA